MELCALTDMKFGGRLFWGLLIQLLIEIRDLNQLLCEHSDCYKSGQCILTQDLKVQKKGHFALSFSFYEKPFQNPFCRLFFGPICCDLVTREDGRVNIS